MSQAPLPLGDSQHPSAGDEWVRTVRDRPSYRRVLRLESRRVVYEDFVLKPGIEQRVSLRAWRIWASEASYRGSAAVSP